VISGEVDELVQLIVIIRDRQALHVVPVTDLRDRGEGEVWQRLSVCAEEHLAWTLKIDWTKLSQISNTSYKKGFVILNIVQPPPHLATLLEKFIWQPSKLLEQFTPFLYFTDQLV
jgi:hypothetical protein